MSAPILHHPMLQLDPGAPPSRQRESPFSLYASTISGTFPSSPEFCSIRSHIGGRSPRREAAFRRTLSRIRPRLGATSELPLKWSSLSPPGDPTPMVASSMRRQRASGSRSLLRKSFRRRVGWRRSIKKSTRCASPASVRSFRLKSIHSSAPDPNSLSLRGP